MTTQTIRSENDKYNLFDLINNIPLPIKVIIEKEAKTRTKQQNKALHKYFALLAQALNDAGYDIVSFHELTKGKLDASWSEEAVKKRLWKPYQEIITGKESTANQTTKEYVEIYKEVDFRIAQLTGVHVEWPHEEY